MLNSNSINTQTFQTFQAKPLVSKVFWLDFNESIF